jgi:hypothetical protein
MTLVIKAKMYFELRFRILRCAHNDRGLIGFGEIETSISALRRPCEDALCLSAEGGFKASAASRDVSAKYYAALNFWFFSFKRKERYYLLNSSLRLDDKLFAALTF